MSSWDEILHQQLVQPGACFAAALGNAPPELGLYAVAPPTSGWSHILAPDHVEQIQVDTDQFSAVNISEISTIKAAIMEGRVPHGIWMGKTKYKLVQYDPSYEIANTRTVCIFANRPKGGAHIICTPKTVIIGLYSEDLGQISGNAKRAVTRFAEYLVENGY